MNQPPTPKLTRRVLSRLKRTSIHEARNWSKADVYIVEWPKKSGQKVVIKDLKKRPFWFRVMAGRHFLRREWKALSALQGLPGITKTIARPDADSFAIEYREGKKAVEFKRRDLSPEIIQRAEAVLADAHARGVTHGDLHNDNILIHDDGSVTLIDWATGTCFGEHPTGVKAVAFNEWRGMDERAIAKLKISHTPTAITARERELLLRGGSKIYRNTKKVQGWIKRLRGQSLEGDLRKQQKYRHRVKKYYQPPEQETSSADDETVSTTKQI